MHIFVTSDQHFGDTSIFNNHMQEHKFESLQARDQYLIDQWNSVVTDDDIVYQLGDFFCPRQKGNTANKEHLAAILTQLNGTIHLSVGNHDSSKFQQVYQDLGVIVNPIGERFKFDHINFLTSHYPMDVRPWPHRNEPIKFVNLHGHIHNQANFDELTKLNAINVNIDLFDTAKPIVYGLPKMPFGQPIPIETIIKYVKKPTL